MQNIYYVYYYLRNKDSIFGKKGTPYYVGKGKNGRINSRHTTVKIPPDPANRVIIAENLSEESAHSIEKIHISIWKRINNGGILRNLTDGGEGISGYKYSPEQCKRRSELQKITNSNIETKIKRSIAMKKAQNRPETNLKRSRSLKIFNSMGSSIERSIRQIIIQNNPETNMKRSKSLIISNSKPDVIERKRAAQLKPEVAEKRAMLEADPQYKEMKRQRAIESGNRPEVKEKQRLARQLYLSDPKNRIACEYCNKQCLKSDYVKNHGKNCKLMCQSK